MGAEEAQLPRHPDHERRQRIWELRMVKRWTLAEIGAEVGFSEARVSQIMKELLAATPQQTREEMIARSAATLDSVHRRLEELAEKVKDGAPVTVGKDGTILYEVGPDGRERMVRDYSGIRAVLADIRATDNDIAKRWGLNAPDRLETTMKGSVRYEIVDVGGDELT
jgi:transcriptional regulator with XRE-family HTH domain